MGKRNVKFRRSGTLTLQFKKGKQGYQEMRTETRRGKVWFSLKITLIKLKVKFHFFNEKFFCLYHTDGHSTVDIIFKWVAGDTEVSVGNKELAQFEYKGSTLTSGADEFGADGKELKTTKH